jgi:hypothetical protein
MMLTLQPRGSGERDLRKIKNENEHGKVHNSPITIISAVVDIAACPASKTIAATSIKGTTTKYLSEAEGDLFTFYSTHPTFAGAGYACRSKSLTSHRL